MPCRLGRPLCFLVPDSFRPNYWKIPKRWTAVVVLTALEAGYSYRRSTQRSWRCWISQSISAFQRRVADTRGVEKHKVIAGNIRCIFCVIWEPNLNQLIREKISPNNPDMDSANRDGDAHRGGRAEFCPADPT